MFTNNSSQPSELGPKNSVEQMLTASHPVLSLDDPATIRALFKKVRELHRSGEQYPAQLDDWWPLVHERKDIAVRSLKKNFFQDADYQVSHRSAENPKGGRPDADYRLTVSCLEYFIARKVRAVFDVYREVFHQVIDKVEQALPMTPAEALVHQAEMFLKTAQAVVEHERRIATVEERVDYLFQNQRQAQAELIALPQPTEPLAELSHPDQVRRIVNQYASAKSMPTQDVWRMLYSEMFYRFKVSVNHMKQLAGESKIQTLVRNGHAEKLYTLALHMFRIEQPVQA